MTEVFASVGGYPCQRIELSEPARGVWFVDALLADAQVLTGRVEVVIGGMRLSGTVAQEYSGGAATTGGRKVRVVAGGGGWGSLLPRRTYHSELGVRTRTVAQDAATAAGETLGAFAPAAERLGVDWVREAGTASRALEWAAGGVSWWLDRQGVTHVGARAAVNPAGAYQLLTYDAGDRLVTLTADDPAIFGPGTLISDRLESPLTIREYRVLVESGKLTLEGWCGGEADSYSRLGRSLTALAQHATRGRLRGRYRFRVSSMSGDRVMLEPVRKDLGLSTIGPVKQRPGVAGCWAQLAHGAEVVVSFLDDGDPAWPCIEGFPAKGDACFIPTSLEICGPGAPAARLGDSVSVFFPPTIPFTAQLVGGAYVGTMTILNAAPGIINAGSGKVKIG